MVGDEINRASPKTQSALLESMEERQVTVDGTTYELPSPFMVIATQNPVEMEGTYPLPEAQRDRFMARVSIGYPSPDAELKMLDVHGGASPLDDLQPVAHAHEIVKLIEAVRQVHVADPVRRYAVALVGATRNHPDLRLGASPAGHPAPGARGPGVGGAGRPGLRAAGRRAVAGLRGAGAPAAAHRAGPVEPAHARAGGRRDPAARPGADTAAPRRPQRPAGPPAGSRPYSQQPRRAGL